MVPLLEMICVNFLMKTLSPTNVFSLLDQCLKWEVSAELLDKCKEVLQKQTKEVLISDEFYSINRECLIVLLEQEILSVTEGELLKSVNKTIYFEP